MRKKSKAFWVYAATVVAVFALVAINYFWLDPSSVATNSLRQQIISADELKIRAGWRDKDSRTSESVILPLTGKELTEFISLLRVHHDRAVFSPAGIPFYTFEFYRAGKPVADVGYTPRILIWYDDRAPGAAWNDGHFGSARALNYWSRRNLAKMLEPYDEQRKKLLR